MIACVIHRVFRMFRCEIFNVAKSRKTFGLPWSLISFTFLIFLHTLFFVFHNSGRFIPFQ